MFVALGRFPPAGPSRLFRQREQDAEIPNPVRVGSRSATMEVRAGKGKSYSFDTEGNYRSRVSSLVIGESLRNRTEIRFRQAARAVMVKGSPADAPVFPCRPRHS